jgi:hypothetical protein
VAIIMQIKTAFVLIAAVTSSLAMGCSKSDNEQPAGETRASLHRAKSCGDLLADLKGDASFKLNKGIDLQIASINKCIAKYGDVQQCSYYGGSIGYGGGGMATGAQEDSKASAPPAAPNSGASGSERASSYSETNTQKGVDEADIVKNDGKNLYAHGRSFRSSTRGRRTR